MKELEINLRIRDQAARQTQQAIIQGFQKTTAAANKAVDSYEKAAARKIAADAKATAAAVAEFAKITAAADREAKRQADAQARSAAQSVAAAFKAADSVARANQRASDATIKADQRAADAAFKAVAARAKANLDASNKAVSDAQRAADMQAAAIKRSVDAEESRVRRLDQLGRQQLSREEVMLRAHAKVNQKAQQDRVDAAAKALNGEKKGWFDLEGAVGGVGTAVGAAALAYASFATVTKVVGSISGMWKDQRRDIEESVLRVVDYQKKLRELADLKGHAGRTTPELAAQLGLRAVTTQTADDAQKFSEGILNAGAVAKEGKLISEKEFQKLTEQGGKVQAVKGLDPEAAGNFFGGLPALFGGKDQKADDITARGLTITKILQAGKSSASSGISQFQNIQSLANSGSFKSPEELAATQSYLSLFGADSAGEATQQYLRATTGALDRTRRGGIEGGEAQGAYLDSIGAKAGMTSNEIAARIFEDTKKAKDADPNFNMDSYFAHKGYGNQEDRLTLGRVMQGMENNQFDTFMGMADPGKRLSIGDAMRSTEESLRIDPTADARRSELTKDAADVAKGTGPEQKYLDARKQAFDRLSAMKKVTGKFDESDKDDNYRGLILDEVQREINARAKKAGVPYVEGYDDPMQALPNAMFGTGRTHGPLGGHPMDRLGISEATRAKYYAELETNIGRAGGGGIDNSALIDLTKQLLESSKRMEDTILKGMPGAVPPMQPAAPLLNAGPPGRPNKI
jgi:hypothetical protein